MFEKISYSILLTLDDIVPVSGFASVGLIVDKALSMADRNLLWFLNGNPSRTTISYAKVPLLNELRDKSKFKYQSSILRWANSAAMNARVRSKDGLPTESSERVMPVVSNLSRSINAFRSHSIRAVNRDEEDRKSVV